MKIEVKNKPKILWFAYPKKGGWAFEVRTYNLINLLSNYEHIVLPPTRHLKIYEGIIESVDIVMVWNDITYGGISDKNKLKIIQCFTGERMLDKIKDADKRKIYYNPAYLRDKKYLKDSLRKIGYPINTGQTV